MRGYMEVFVYGTLKMDFPNHRVMKSAKGVWFGNACLHNARIYGEGRFFPTACLVDDPESYIFGEVYTVPCSLVRHLDRLEGHPNWYRRQKVKVYYEKLSFIDPQGRECSVVPGKVYSKAWIYVRPEKDLIYEGLTRVRTGRWEGKRYA